MTEESATLRELRAIKKILLLSNSKVIEEELSKIATTDDRKRMWVLIDGKRMAKDIALKLKVTERAVNYFLAATSAAELIEYARGQPPRKILDYTPPTWIDLVRLPEVSEGEKEGQVGSGKGQNTLTKGGEQ